LTFNSPGWRDIRTHHTVVLALRPLVLEASLLEEASRPVVEERDGDLLFLPIPRLALHDATTRLGDEVQSTP
jgi:hypothetical protein